MTTISPSKVTFEHILVPTDFSVASELALEYAKAIARQSGSELLLVHVDPPINPIAAPETAWIDEGEILRLEAEQLEQVGAALRSEGFRARTISLTGLVQDEILSAVKQYRVDLIVLGTHGRGGLERFLLGSDAEAVLRHASCPVLAIGPAVPKPRETMWHPREVICATTLNADFAPVAAYAYVLARRHEARFALFHVKGRDTHDDVDWQAFERILRRNISEEIEVPPLLTWLTDTAPGTGIVDLAKHRNPDLIVMGARTASALATHLVRGIVPKVLTEITCPVMTLHQP